MTHRRAFDPYASCRPADEAPPDEDACGSVEPQEPPGVEDEQSVDPAPDDAQGGQEPPQSGESDLEQPETPSTTPEPGESDTEPPSDDEMPDLADDLVAWVGDNPARARAALAREQHRPRPRKRVLALERLLEDG